MELIGMDLTDCHHCKESKVCRVLSHEFGLVRLYRTFSNYRWTGTGRIISRAPRLRNPAVCLCTGSSASNLEPTFLNYIIAERARCIEFFYMSSGWFDCTEHSLTTSLDGKQFVQDAYALVRGSSSASNLLNSRQRLLHTFLSLH